MRREQYKWRADGRLGWEHYQETVEEDFIGWEKEVKVIDEVREGCLGEVCRGKRNGLSSSRERNRKGEKMMYRSEG